MAGFQSKVVIIWDQNVSEKTDYPTVKAAVHTLLTQVVTYLPCTDLGRSDIALGQSVKGEFHVLDPLRRLQIGQSSLFLPGGEEDNLKKKTR